MAESRINVFVFGIVFDGVRIDGDEDAPDARDKRQRAAMGTPGMGRRIARNWRHSGLKELYSSGLFIGKFSLC